MPLRQTAGKAAQRLVKAGFSSVYMLAGGMAAWQQAQLPVAKGKQVRQPTRCVDDSPLAGLVHAGARDREYRRGRR